MITFKATTQGASATNTDTTLTLNKPAANPGDLIFGRLAWQTPGTAGTLVGLSGWTIISGASGHGAGSTGIQLFNIYRVASSSDPTSFTFERSNTQGRFAGSLSTYSGVDTTNPIAASSFNGAPGSPTTVRPTNPVTTTQGTEWLLSSFSDRANTTYTGPDTNRVFQGGTNTTLFGQDSNASVPAGTYTRSATASGTSGTSAQSLVALKAASTVLTSTAYRWNGTAYVPLDSYRWSGTAYVALDRANP